MKTVNYAIIILLVSLVSVGLAAQPTTLGVQGKVTYGGSPYAGDLGVNISTISSCTDNLIYSNVFTGEISNGLFNVLLGASPPELNLDYNVDYWMCISAGGTKIGGPFQFRGGQGQIDLSNIAQANDLPKKNVNENITGQWSFRNLLTISSPVNPVGLRIAGERSFVIQTSGTGPTTSLQFVDETGSKSFDFYDKANRVLGVRIIPIAYKIILGDVSLYRSAANTLRVDGNLQVTKHAAIGADSLVSPTFPLIVFEKVNTNSTTSVRGTHSVVEQRGTGPTRGVYGSARTQAGNGNVSQLIGVHGNPIHYGTGTVPAMYGVFGQNTLSANTKATTSYGIYGASAEKGAGANVTNDYAGGFSGDVILTGAGNKLFFTTDTNLYRSAANTLKTDDALEVAGNYLKVPTLASTPSSPQAGMIYFNTADKHFYGYDGTAWKQLDNP